VSTSTPEVCGQACAGASEIANTAARADNRETQGAKCEQAMTPTSLTSLHRAKKKAGSVRGTHAARFQPQGVIDP
jgi:hypothetical protein